MNFIKMTHRNPSHWCRSLPIWGPLIVFLAVVFLLILRQNVSATDLTDQSGRTIHFDRPFTRIISLYGAHTENLASLGLDKEIIGRTGDDDFPQSIAHKPEFSDKDDPEKFIAARPDLVLIRPMVETSHPELFTKLQQAGITIVSLQPTNIDQMYAYWRNLGELTGTAEKAEAMIREFQAGLAQVREKFSDIPAGKRPKVYFESIHAKMRTFSPDSITLFSLESAGGINIAIDATPRHATNIAEYGKERILSHAQDIDVFLAQTGRMNRVDRVTLLEEPGFQAIKAIQDGRVYLIDEKLVSRPTMRLLLGIQQLNELLYPRTGQAGNH
jgi:iron complex transport system substrate-binding protein